MRVTVAVLVVAVVVVMVAAGAAVHRHRQHHHSSITIAATSHPPPRLDQLALESRTHESVLVVSHQERTSPPGQPAAPRSNESNQDFDAPQKGTVPGYPRAIRRVIPLSQHLSGQGFPPFHDNVAAKSLQTSRNVSSVYQKNVSAHDFQKNVSVQQDFPTSQNSVPDQDFLTPQHNVSAQQDFPVSQHNVSAQDSLPTSSALHHNVTANNPTQQPHVNHLKPGSESPGSTDEWSSAKESLTGVHPTLWGNHGTPDHPNLSNNRGFYQPEPVETPPLYGSLQQGRIDNTESLYSNPTKKTKLHQDHANRTRAEPDLDKSSSDLTELGSLPRYEQTAVEYSTEPHYHHQARSMTDGGASRSTEEEEYQGLHRFPPPLLPETVYAPPIRPEPFSFMRPRTRASIVDGEQESDYYHGQYPSTLPLLRIPLSGYHEEYYTQQNSTNEAHSRFKDLELESNHEKEPWYPKQGPPSASTGPVSKHTQCSCPVHSVPHIYPAWPTVINGPRVPIQIQSKEPSTFNPEVPATDFLDLPEENVDAEIYQFESSERDVAHLKGSDFKQEQPMPKALTNFNNHLYQGLRLPYYSVVNGNLDEGFLNDTERNPNLTDTAALSFESLKIRELPGEVTDGIPQNFEHYSIINGRNIHDSSGTPFQNNDASSQTLPIQSLGPHKLSTSSSQSPRTPPLSQQYQGFPSFPSIPPGFSPVFSTSRYPQLFEQYPTNVDDLSNTDSGLADFHDALRAHNQGFLPENYDYDYSYDYDYTVRQPSQLQLNDTLLPPHLQPEETGMPVHLPSALSQLPVSGSSTTSMPISSSITMVNGPSIQQQQPFPSKGNQSSTDNSIHQNDSGPASTTILPISHFRTNSIPPFVSFIPRTNSISFPEELSLTIKPSPFPSSVKNPTQPPVTLFSTTVSPIPSIPKQELHEPAVNKASLFESDELEYNTEAMQDFNQPQNKGSLDSKMVKGLQPESEHNGSWVPKIQETSNASSMQAITQVPRMKQSPQNAGTQEKQLIPSSSAPPATDRVDFPTVNERHKNPVVQDKIDTIHLPKSSKIPQVLVTHGIPQAPRTTHAGQKLGAQTTEAPGIKHLNVHGTQYPLLYNTEAPQVPKTQTTQIFEVQTAPHILTTEFSKAPETVTPQVSETQTTQAPRIKTFHVHTTQTSQEPITKLSQALQSHKQTPQPYGIRSSPFPGTETPRTQGTQTPQALGKQDQLVHEAKNSQILATQSPQVQEKALQFHETQILPSSIDETQEKSKSSLGNIKKHTASLIPEVNKMAETIVIQHQGIPVMWDERAMLTATTGPHSGLVSQSAPQDHRQHLDEGDKGNSKVITTRLPSVLRVQEADREHLTQSIHPVTLRTETPNAEQITQKVAQSIIEPRESDKVLVVQPSTKQLIPSDEGINSQYTSFSPIPSSSHLSSHMPQTFTRSPVKQKPLIHTTLQDTATHTPKFSIDSQKSDDAPRHLMDLLGFPNHLSKGSVTEALPTTNQNVRKPSSNSTLAADDKANNLQILRSTEVLWINFTKTYAVDSSVLNSTNIVNSLAETIKGTIDPDYIIIPRKAAGNYLSDPYIQEQHNQMSRDKILQKAVNALKSPNKTFVPGMIENFNSEQILVNENNTPHSSPEPDFNSEKVKVSTLIKSPEAMTDKLKHLRVISADDLTQNEQSSEPHGPVMPGYEYTSPKKEFNTEKHVPVIDDDDEGEFLLLIPNINPSPPPEDEYLVIIPHKNDTDFSDNIPHPLSRYVRQEDYGNFNVDISGIPQGHSFNHQKVSQPDPTQSPYFHQEERLDMFSLPSRSTQIVSDGKGPNPVSAPTNAFQKWLEPFSGNAGLPVQNEKHIDSNEKQEMNTMQNHNETEIHTGHWSSSILSSEQYDYQHNQYTDFSSPGPDPTEILADGQNVEHLVNPIYISATDIMPNTKKSKIHPLPDTKESMQQHLLEPIINNDEKQVDITDSIVGTTKNINEESHYDRELRYHNNAHENMEQRSNNDSVVNTFRAQPNRSTDFQQIVEPNKGIDKEIELDPSVDIIMRVELKSGADNVHETKQHLNVDAVQEVNQDTSVNLAKGLQLNIGADVQRFQSHVDTDAVQRIQPDTGDDPVQRVESGLHVDVQSAESYKSVDVNNKLGVDTDVDVFEKEKPNLGAEPQYNTQLEYVQKQESEHNLSGKDVLQRQAMHATRVDDALMSDELLHIKDIDNSEHRSRAEHNIGDSETADTREQKHNFGSDSVIQKIEPGNDQIFDIHDKPEPHTTGGIYSTVDGESPYHNTGNDNRRTSKPNFATIMLEYDTENNDDYSTETFTVTDGLVATVRTDSGHDVVTSEGLGDSVLGDLRIFNQETVANTTNKTLERKVIQANLEVSKSLEEEEYLESSSILHSGTQVEPTLSHDIEHPVLIPNTTNRNHEDLSMTSNISILHAAEKDVAGNEEHFQGDQVDITSGRVVYVEIGAVPANGVAILPESIIKQTNENKSLPNVELSLKDEKNTLNMAALISNVGIPQPTIDDKTLTGESITNGFQLFNAGENLQINRESLSINEDNNGTKRENQNPSDHGHPDKNLQTTVTEASVSIPQDLMKHKTALNDMEKPSMTSRFSIHIAHDQLPQEHLDSKGNMQQPSIISKLPHPELPTVMISDTAIKNEEYIHNTNIQQTVIPNSRQQAPNQKSVTLEDTKSNQEDMEPKLVQQDTEPNDADSNKNDLSQGNLASNERKSENDANQFVPNTQVLQLLSQLSQSHNEKYTAISKTLPVGLHITSNDMKNPFPALTDINSSGKKTINLPSILDTDNGEGNFNLKVIPGQIEPNKDVQTHKDETQQFLNSEKLSEGVKIVSSDVTDINTMSEESSQSGEFIILTSLQKPQEPHILLESSIKVESTEAMDSRENSQLNSDTSLHIPRESTRNVFLQNSKYLQNWVKNDPSTENPPTMLGLPHVTEKFLLQNATKPPLPGFFNPTAITLKVTETTATTPAVFLPVINPASESSMIISKPETGIIMWPRPTRTPSPTTNSMLFLNTPKNSDSVSPGNMPSQKQQQKWIWGDTNGRAETIQSQTENFKAITASANRSGISSSQNIFMNETISRQNKGNNRDSAMERWVWANGKQEAVSHRTHKQPHRSN